MSLKCISLECVLNGNAISHVGERAVKFCAQDANDIVPTFLRPKFPKDRSTGRLITFAPKIHITRRNYSRIYAPTVTTPKNPKGISDLSHRIHRLPVDIQYYEEDTLFISTYSWHAIILHITYLRPLIIINIFPFTANTQLMTAECVCPQWPGPPLSVFVNARSEKWFNFGFNFAAALWLLHCWRCVSFWATIFRFHKCITEWEGRISAWRGAWWHRRRQAIKSCSMAWPITLTSNNTRCEEPIPPTGFVQLNTKHSSAISLLLIFSAWLNRMRTARRNVRQASACGLEVRAKFDVRTYNVSPFSKMIQRLLAPRQLDSATMRV